MTASTADSTAVPRLIELLHGAWLAGEVDVVRRAGELLLDLEDLSRAQAAQIMNRVMHVAPSLREVVPGVTYHRITAEIPTGWQLTNPAIHPTAEPRRALVRRVNYRAISPDYAVHASDGVTRTEVCLVDLTDTLTVDGYREVSDCTRLANRRQYPIWGFEDCRPFRFDGIDHAIATMRELSAAGVCQMVLLTLEDDRIVAPQILSTVDEGDQKNWMPVAGASEMLFIQQCHPLLVRRFDPATGETPLIHKEASPRFLAWFRGGSALVPFDHGYLALIHEAVDDALRCRLYLHRFVYFDHNLKPVMCTDQFWFLQFGIEFAAGLRLEGDDLIASFGVNDASAWLARMPADAIRAKLVPIAERTTGDPGTLLQAKPAPRTAPVSATKNRNGVVSVTLAGDGSGAELEGALRSVLDQVDRCLAINTGTTDEVDRIAEDVAGDKALVRTFPWPNDFAAARNAALHLAGETGAAWALILDSDERIRFGHVDLRQRLDGVDDDVEVLNVSHYARTYAKPRLFRLPVVGAYVGATHEYFDRKGRREQALAGIVFDELAKDADRLRQKSERDIAILTQETLHRPTETRWFYYLGDALQNIGRHVEAIDAFRSCAAIDGWAEERAWACFREANSWFSLNHPDRALERCAVGLGIHPGIAELAWLAGYACWQLKQDASAIEWAHLAIVHGEFRGRADRRERTGFRHLPGLYEGPFDVMRYAYRRLGDETAADLAEADYQAALATRLALFESP